MQMSLFGPPDERHDDLSTSAGKQKRGDDREKQLDALGEIPPKPHDDEVSVSENLTSAEQDHDDITDEASTVSQEEGFPGRANRFAGSAKQYRALNEEELAVLHHVQHEEASDLARHLFSTHRLYTSVEPAEEVQRNKSGSTTIIRKDWFAWPVPRPEAASREHTPDFNDTAWQSISLNATEAQNLQESLLASVWRLDRENQVSFLRGHSSGQTSPHVSEGNNHEIDGLFGNQSPQLSVQEGFILPDIRHAMFELDRLLVALHRSRHVLVDSRRRSRRSSAVHHTEEDADGDLSGRDSGTDMSQESTVSRLPHHQTIRFPLQRDELVARDWTEVLRMASLIGWSRQPLDRAIERCSQLFGCNPASAVPKRFKQS